MIYKGFNICILFAISILLAACQQDADIVIPEVADNDDLATSSYLAETGRALVNGTLSAEVDTLNDLVGESRKTLDINRITSGTFYRSVRFYQATIDFLYPKNITVRVNESTLLLCTQLSCNVNEYQHVGYEFFPLGTDNIQEDHIQLPDNSYFKLLNLTSLSNVQIKFTFVNRQTINADFALYIYYGNYGIRLKQGSIVAAYNRFNLDNVGTDNLYQSYGAEIVLTMCGLYDADNDSEPSWHIGSSNITGSDLNDQLMPNDPNLVDLFFISKPSGADIKIKDIQLSSVDCDDT